MNTKKILGVVAVLALVAVAFVGAGAATDYYVADDGVESDTSSEGYPMSTTYFLKNVNLTSSDTVNVSSGKTMTIPKGTTFDQNGATLNAVGTMTIEEGATYSLNSGVLNITGTVTLSGDMNTPALKNKLTGTNLITLMGTSVLTVTNDATNDLSKVTSYIGTAKEDATIIVKASSTASGAKWVVNSDTTGEGMTETGDNPTVTRTNLAPASGITAVSYESALAYIVTIPDSVTLKSDAAVEREYKIQITNAGESTDGREVVLKLASSQNKGSGSTLNVKNIYGSGLVPYYMVDTSLNNHNIVDNTAVAAIRVDGTQAYYNTMIWQTPSEKTVTAKVQFGNATGDGGVSGLSAGSYQDTLTFSVGIETAGTQLISIHLPSTGGVHDGSIGSTGKIVWENLTETNQNTTLLNNIVYAKVGSVISLVTDKLDQTTFEITIDGDVYKGTLSDATGYSFSKALYYGDSWTSLTNYIATTQGSQTSVTRNKETFIGIALSIEPE